VSGVEKKKTMSLANIESKLISIISNQQCKNGR
jgi:hypothetical protein